MWTCAAYTASIATGAPLLAVSALIDQHVRTQGNDIVVPQQMANLLGAYAGSANVTRAQLQSPSLRRFLNPELGPVDNSATPGSPSRFQDWFENPIPLDPGEFLDAFAAQGSGGGQQVFVGVWLGDGIQAPANGFVNTVRVTGTTTVTANTWSAVTLTFDQTLPAGMYHLVGARFRSTTGILFRFVFPGYAWRPGGVANVAVGDVPYHKFRQGRLGSWGTFAHNVPPVVEVLCTAADTAQTFELDLIHISGQVVAAY